MSRAETTGYKIIVLEYRIRWFQGEIAKQQNAEIAHKLTQKMNALKHDLEFLRYNVTWQYV
jgi:hypothetical protein